MMASSSASPTVAETGVVLAGPILDDVETGGGLLLTEGIPSDIVVTWRAYGPPGHILICAIIGGREVRGDRDVLIKFGQVLSFAVSETWALNRHHDWRLCRLGRIGRMRINAIVAPCVPSGRWRLLDRRIDHSERSRR